MKFWKLKWILNIIYKLFRWLSLSGNSIKSLTNNSFTRISDDLEYLDISHLDLNTFEVCYSLLNTHIVIFFYLRYFILFPVDCISLILETLLLWICILKLKTHSLLSNIQTYHYHRIALTPSGASTNRFLCNMNSIKSKSLWGRIGNSVE